MVDFRIWDKEISRPKRTWSFEQVIVALSREYLYIEVRKRYVKYAYTFPEGFHRGAFELVRDKYLYWFL